MLTYRVGLVWLGLVLVLLISAQVQAQADPWRNSFSGRLDQAQKEHKEAWLRQYEEMPMEEYRQLLKERVAQWGDAEQLAAEVTVDLQKASERRTIPLKRTDGTDKHYTLGEQAVLDIINRPGLKSLQGQAAPKVAAMRSRFGVVPSYDKSRDYEQVTLELNQEAAKALVNNEAVTDLAVGSRNFAMYSAAHGRMLPAVPELKVDPQVLKDGYYYEIKEQFRINGSKQRKLSIVLIGDGQFEFASEALENAYRQRGLQLADEVFSSLDPQCRRWGHNIYNEQLGRSEFKPFLEPFYISAYCTEEMADQLYLDNRVKSVSDGEFYNSVMPGPEATDIKESD